MKIMRIAFKSSVKSRHLSWVHALRHPGRTTGRMSPASMRFLRPPQPLLTTTLHTHLTPLHFTPHFHLSSLTRLHNRDSHHLYPANHHVTTIHAQRPNALTINEQSTSHSIRREATHTLLRIAATLRRLTAQSRLAATTSHLNRTITSQQPQATQPHLPANAPAAILIQRSSRIEETVARLSTEVARKQAAAAAASPHGSAASPPTASANRNSHAPTDSVHVAPWLTSAPPALNIDQLTEQVIRQIDSRMIAHRERMGKF
jgi:hypothetical protein